MLIKGLHLHVLVEMVVCLSLKSGRVVQIALELILGFDETLLTDATIERCTEAFGDWNEGLFSFPVNIPGTCALSGHEAGCKAGSHQ